MRSSTVSVCLVALAALCRPIFTAAPPILGGPITGTITNGATGQPEPGVSLKFHYASTVMDQNGYALPNKTGVVAGSATTKADGTYSITLPAGCVQESSCQYSAEITKTNFFTTYLMTTSFNGQDGPGQDWHVQPYPVDNKIRVVLTWNTAQPMLWAKSDPQADGSKTTLFWNNPGSSDAAPYMTLSGEYDVIFGPQLITIEPTATGSWTYIITDTTSSGMDLAKSGTQIRVFKGKTTLKTFNVPQQAGNNWTVFKMTGSVITPINTLTTVTALPQEWGF